MPHCPVMLREVMGLLNIRAGGVYVDGTVGAGGHAGAIWQAMQGQGVLLGLDRDQSALALARSRLPPEVLLEWSEYSAMEAAAGRHGLRQAQGVLLDLGVSSMQLDDPARGFSFMRDGPLDMRMNPQQALAAEQLVNEASEEELAGILKRWGEEPRARRIASAIVRARAVAPFRRTQPLAEVIARAVGGRRSAVHPATRSFQALRLAVNHELEELAEGLQAAWRLLAPGGRLAVISFHSLEDRLVKDFMRRHEGAWESLPEGGSRWQGDRPQGRRITRKVVVADPAEVAENPRARSAKLRVMEKVEA